MKHKARGWKSSRALGARWPAAPVPAARWGCPHGRCRTPLREPATRHGHRVQAGVSLLCEFDHPALKARVHAGHEGDAVRSHSSCELAACGWEGCGQPSLCLLPSAELDGTALGRCTEPDHGITRPVAITHRVGSARVPASSPPAWGALCVRGAAAAGPPRAATSTSPTPGGGAEQSGLWTPRHGSAPQKHIQEPQGDLPLCSNKRAEGLNWGTQRKGGAELPPPAHPAPVQGVLCPGPGPGLPSLLSPRRSLEGSQRPVPVLGGRGTAPGGRCWGSGVLGTRSGAAARGPRRAPLPSRVLGRGGTSKGGAPPGRGHSPVPGGGSPGGSTKADSCSSESR